MSLFSLSISIWNFPTLPSIPSSPRQTAPPWRTTAASLPFTSDQSHRPAVQYHHTHGTRLQTPGAERPPALHSSRLKAHLPDQTGNAIFFFFFFFGFTCWHGRFSATVMAHATLWAAYQNRAAFPTLLLTWRNKSKSSWAVFSPAPRTVDLSASPHLHHSETTKCQNLERRLFCSPIPSTPRPPTFTSGVWGGVDQRRELEASDRTPHKGQEAASAHV